MLESLPPPTTQVDFLLQCGYFLKSSLRLAHTQNVCGRKHRNPRRKVKHQGKGCVEDTLFSTFVCTFFFKRVIICMYLRFEDKGKAPNSLR